MSDQDVINIEQRSGVLLASIACERMDEDLTNQMQTEVYAAAAQTRRLPLVLDLSRVEFFPSLSLGALVKILGEFKKHGQRLILVGLQPSLRSALAVTRLDKLFEIYDTVDEATKQLRLGDAAV
jgi:anti-sigma B factor antagonist